MDFATIDALRGRHPAWRLLRAGNAALTLSFLGSYFVDGNRGATSVSEVAVALDEQLHALNSAVASDDEESRFPKSARSYLDDWSATDAGWLRRFYPAGEDEVHYEITPAFEKAYVWVESLQGRAFVGTESASGSRATSNSPGTQRSSCEPDSISPPASTGIGRCSSRPAVAARTVESSPPSSRRRTSRFGPGRWPSSGAGMSTSGSIGASSPVTHRTRRVGRPHTLVLVKQASLFASGAQARAADSADLAWLDDFIAQVSSEPRSRKR